MNGPVFSNGVGRLPVPSLGTSRFVLVNIDGLQVTILPARNNGIHNLHLPYPGVLAIAHARPGHSLSNSLQGCGSITANTIH